jgi:hypothetical protein
MVSLVRDIKKDCLLWKLQSFVGCSNEMALCFSDDSFGEFSPEIHGPSLKRSERFIFYIPTVSNGLFPLKALSLN